MRNFVYPAVVYHDDETNTYVMNIDDLYIVGEGNSIEEAHEKARESLNRYAVAAIKYDLDFVEPTKFDVMHERYPKKLVMLVECQIDETKICKK